MLDASVTTSMCSLIHVTYMYVYHTRSMCLSYVYHICVYHNYMCVVCVLLNMIYDTNAGKNVQNLLSEHNLTTDIHIILHFLTLC